MLALIAYGNIEMSFGSIPFFHAALLVFCLGMLILCGYVNGRKYLSESGSNMRYIEVKNVAYDISIAAVVFTCFVFIQFISNPGPGPSELASSSYFERIRVNINFYFLLVSLFLFLPFFSGFWISRAKGFLKKY